VFADVLLVGPFALGARDTLVLASSPSARRAPWLVRTDGDRDFPSAARAMLASSRFASIESMAERQEGNHANVRGLALVTGVLVAMLIAVGVIGSGVMVSLFIDVRTREIGLRRALGARRGEVVGQLVVEALLLCSGGALLGVAQTYLVAMLVGVPLRSIDPRVVAGAVGAVYLFTAVDTWIPARRAARIPPAVAGKIS
jgi:ABC-type antimicrobial peptide transport system permease subunit